MKEYIFEVEDGEFQRLDMYLVRRFSEEGGALSRARLQKLIHDGQVLLNDAPVKAHHKIKAYDKIKVIIKDGPEHKLKAQDIPLEIIYEDDDVILINKQRGLIVHPGAGNPDGTLVNALLFHCRNLSSIDPNRPGIVHRLDKDTAGIMVIAKNDAAHMSLSRQFAAHSIKRIYIALVLGRVEFDEGAIDLPIGRHPFNREKMSVNFKDEAREALTRYKVLKRYKEFTYLSLMPQTGRTHQLRVHMASLGHPILGDVIYGRKHKAAEGLKEKLNLALYAKYLGFIHPATGKFMEFEHSLPEDMQDILDNANKQ
ncbi:MAG: RNA pseudouridine synthase [Candidatus Omnitrophica bacterium CG11_big_fil_rev_8_21_14_0_20_42_13]|uniref:Pseudouridine synthase n=1 Tax=Candidatus Ghiorseimicrobium undicola TaxID=1974746 RepID=A0A2H0LXT7_9BACT|nr:MAG: RNA pseudouridine synthase [Candidatus Omnitrophica bacterium CG11_big_fil_rev_8_21_14_0_20_42_13]